MGHNEAALRVRMWRLACALLRDIQRSAPFVELTRRAEAAEQGPAQVVAAEWQRLCQKAEEANCPEYRALIEAAYAEPRLRQLYPYTSHWSLRLSTTTGGPFSPDAVCFEAGPADHVVKASWRGPVLSKTATAEEAVALAVRHLPSYLGPAVAGAYRYDRGR